jgi:hypothetical protein
MTKGARMTARPRSSISAHDSWVEYIKQEFDAFEQRELTFLARDRDDRLRELANWLKADLADKNNKNFAG